MIRPQLLQGYFTVAKVGRKALPTVQAHEGLDWRVITPDNLDSFLEMAGKSHVPTIHEYSDRLVFENCVLDGVDLTDSIKQIELNACVGVNSQLPAYCIVYGSTLINTPTLGKSLFINTHFESGRAGRCDVGPDSYLKDCSVFNGMVVNSGTVMLSCLSFGTKHSHIESDVAIYGGTHYKNTYDKGVEVLYINPAEVRGAYQQFLDRNNKYPGFHDVMPLESIYTHAEAAISDSLINSCKVVYPDNISSPDFLIKKSISERNVGDFIRAEYRGQIRSHEATNTDLLEACISAKARTAGPGNQSTKIASRLFAGIGELIDECQRAYRRNSGALMTGFSDDSVTRFTDDFLAGIYRLRVDKTQELEQVIDSLLTSADKNLEGGLDRIGAYKLIESADKCLSEECENTATVKP